MTAPGYCPHGVLPDQCALCLTEAVKGQPAESFTDYDRAKLAVVTEPPPVDNVIRLRCLAPGCSRAPLPARRCCGEHRHLDASLATNETCEYPGDVEGQHDHAECSRRLAAKGRTICALVACWSDAPRGRYCAVHSAQQVSL